MSDQVTCPSCGNEFALADALRAHLEADVRAHVQSELQVKFAEARAIAESAGARESELLAKETALATRAREAEIERERLLASERAKAQAEADRLADERARLLIEKEREAVRREEERLSGELAKMQTTLEEARLRAEAVARHEATVARWQRELEEKEQRAALEIERTLAEERAKLAAAADTSARAHYEALAKTEAERLAREASVEAERVRTDALREKEVMAGALAEARQKASDAEAKELELLRKERALADRERGSALEVERKLADERVRIQQAAEKQATEVAELRARALVEKTGHEAAARVAEVERELTEARKRATEATEKERALLRQQEELDTKRREMELDVERRLVEERKRIQQQTDTLAEERLRMAAEQGRLREQEHEERHAQLQRSLEVLQQKLAQGSQQTQGEAQEVVLRDALASAFPEDRIEDVAKGARGADVIHRVRDVSGEECGTIVWESKRTQSWAEGWLDKVRDDMRDAGGAVAVIVTQALPAGVRMFDVREGVWVCGWPYAQALAAVLRGGILDVHRARRANEGRDSKMLRLYEYLTGNDFKNRLEGVIDAMVTMQEDLDRERRSFVRIWKAREVSIARALEQIGSVYGSLQGIAGAKLGDIDALSLSSVRPNLLEAPSSGALLDGTECVEDDDSGTSDVAVTPELERALYELVPSDGRAIGNLSLKSEFELRHDVTEAQFHAARQRLIAKGMLRKGRGRGGAVMRTAEGLQVQADSRTMVK